MRAPEDSARSEEVVSEDASASPNQIRRVPSGARSGRERASAVAGAAGALDGGRGARGQRAWQSLG